MSQQYSSAQNVRGLPVVRLTRVEAIDQLVAEGDSRARLQGLSDRCLTLAFRRTFDTVNQPFPTFVVVSDQPEIDHELARLDAMVGAA